MVRKLIKGIFLWIVGFWLVYIYFLYAGDVSILRNWIQEHILYTGIFFVSVILIYALQWGNKIQRFAMFILVLVNIFILGDVFFKNNIGLNSGQFITLFGLVVVALAVTYITHRIRFIFMGIVGIGIVFVLLTGILPMYETMPSIQDFISSQKTKILNQWAVGEGILTIKNALGSKDIPVNTLQQNNIDLSQKTQISYASKTQSDMEKMFIDLGNGTFININPQSAITLEQSGNTTIMEILQWNVEYYTPPTVSWALEIVGKYSGKNIQEIPNTIRSNLIGQFEQKKEDFFVSQIGGGMVLNPVINKVIKFFITTLHDISPKTYEKNLDNYNKIQTYFGNPTTGEDASILTGENIRNIMDDVMSQMKKWVQETTIINKLFNK